MAVLTAAAIGSLAVAALMSSEWVQGAGYLVVVAIIVTPQLVIHASHRPPAPRP
jgi:hypothetical protein